jgi:hypothetical protein
MRKFIFALLLTLPFNNSWCQAPEKMSYQAVIRNTSNQLVVSQTIGMRVSILQGSPAGTAVYVETQMPLSNANGLVSIEIGSGSMVSGSFNGIDWANGPFFIQTETDPTGGTSYTLTGTSELLSVPYALHAKTVEIEQDTTIWKLNSSNVYYNGGNVGIGTSNPIHPFHVIGNVMSENGAFISKNSGTPIFQLNRSGVLWESGINSSDNFYIGNSIGSKLTILNSNGYIGIGTSNPTWPLSLTGSAQFSGVPTPGLVLSPSSGSTKIANIFQSTDVLIFGSYGLNNIGSINLNAPAGSFQFDANGNFGLGIVPVRKLHVNSVMRLEPINVAPSSPAKGDMYFDGILNKLRVYDGTTWQNCW